VQSQTEESSKIKKKISISVKKFFYDALIHLQVHLTSMALTLENQLTAV